jgi:hypothetical protein
MIKHPLVRITTTLFLAALIILPFVNGMIKEQYEDIFVISIYFTVACYIVVKKVIEVFKIKLK